MSNVASTSSQVIDPTDTYQLDSDEFDENDSDHGSLDDREYEALLDEGKVMGNVCHSYQSPMAFQMKKWMLWLMSSKRLAWSTS